MINLKKGVQMHPFSDHSGCIFFDSFSGETLSIALSCEQLENLVVEYAALSAQDKVQSQIHGLYRKRFLQQAQ